MAENFGTIHEMLKCPYDQSHIVSASRFPAHIVKCRKQHPNLAKRMIICEYNQTHHIFADAMDEHLLTCREYLNYQYQAQSIDLRLNQCKQKSSNASLGESGVNQLPNSANVSNQLKRQPYNQNQESQLQQKKDPYLQNW